LKLLQTPLQHWLPLPHAMPLVLHATQLPPMQTKSVAQLELLPQLGLMGQPVLLPVQA
jgi:hypothetical protein